MLDCPTADEITSGQVTDHCCTLSGEVLRRLGVGNRLVTLEAHVRRFPADVSRGVFYGLGDVLDVLRNQPVNIWAIRPGTVFLEREPVLIIEGPAECLAPLRPAITGVLTFASSLVTRAYQIVQAAAGKPVTFLARARYIPHTYVSTLSAHMWPEWRLTPHRRPLTYYLTWN